MKLFLKYIKPYVYYYILGPIFMLVEVAGEIILPWLLSKIINVGAANHDVGYITRIGLVMVLVAVCMAVGGVLGAWFAANAAMNFDASVMIITFVLTGRCLEEKAKDSTASSIRQLMGMQPQASS